MLKFIFKVGLFLTFWIGLIGAAILFYYYQDLPKIEELEEKNRAKTVKILYSNQEKITITGDSYANQAAYSEIPKHLIDAVVATEDRRFFSHHGFDVIGIMRASYTNFKAKRIVEGGSTITQQLVKLLFFDSSKTLKRKVQELLLAIEIERIFSKEEIITLYLNRAYFGAGNYGVVSASKYYFNKKVSDIDVNQAAMLAGLLKAPSKLAPTRNKKLAEDRANEVLINMVEAGYLEEKDIGVFGQDIKYETDNLQRLYFANYVIDNFDYYLPKDKRQNSSFVIETTLDQKIQEVTQDVVEKYFQNNSKKLKKSQVAVIVMAKDGAIKAMIGGRDYQKSQFNRAIYSKRQAGSVFKTFVFLEAFNEGYGTEDIFEDKAINIGSWEPENYEKKYYGQVSLKDAFAKSLNSVAVQLLQIVDKEQMVKTSRKMGVFVDVDSTDPTIALGTTPVTLLQLVNAFAVIANDGYGVLPYEIVKINDENGDLIYERQSSGIGEIISPQTIEKIKIVLRQVVLEGTGKIANVNDDIHGKTGTTQNFRDAWFVGFDKDYVIGVWIGNDDNSPTNKITGGSAPAEIFSQIIGQI